MIYRCTPEDFVVEEVSAFEPSGEGSHHYVWVEKRELETTDVARALARSAGCRSGDVGFAGRKDKIAVTRQWFSVPDMGASPELELDGATILRRSRHPHKLRTGVLRGNRFSLIVREVGEPQAILERTEEIRQSGFANRYGQQRFGRHGGNSAKGRAVLTGSRHPRDRRLRRFYVSSFQSFIFNRCLEVRTERYGIGRVLDGDLAEIHQSGGVFWVDDARHEQARADRRELSATGPMWGSKMRRPRGEPLEMERAVLEELEVEESVFLTPGLRLRGARRALRAFALDLDVQCAGDQAVIRMELQSGTYASVFLEELCGPDLKDASRAHQEGRTRDRQSST